jgi:hypothetical protein
MFYKTKKEEGCATKSAWLQGRFGGECQGRSSWR